MNLRRTSSRWALWAFAAALLLKAAMPFLASASAQVQGKALVEVCTVYGVAMVPQGDSHEAPADPAAAHGGDACALQALTLLATAPAPLASLPAATATDPARAGAVGACPAHDACATWVARRKHGPPGLA